MTVLVAGAGNTLRADDGFGVAVAQYLIDGGVPSGVEVAEVGIGGIHLVQRLLDPVDALVVVDAVDLGRAPGTVFVIRPDVVDVTAVPPQQRRDMLADMHYATPERALMLARAIGVLPDETWLVGCQPTSSDGLKIGLSPVVSGAVPAAAGEIRQLVTALGVSWS